jgi:hypothetical protein
MCLSGVQTIAAPAALLRGGGYDASATAGPFSVTGLSEPYNAAIGIGFRCARRL